MIPEDQRRQVQAELARRRRAVVMVAISAVAAVVVLAYLLPPWALLLAVLVEVGLVVMAVTRYRQIVAAARAQGW